jgi:hypothetical protein
MAPETETNYQAGSPRHNQFTALHRQTSIPGILVPGIFFMNVGNEGEELAVKCYDASNSCGNTSLHITGRIEIERSAQTKIAQSRIAAYPK